jgi:hypothetical protein
MGAVVKHRATLASDARNRALRTFVVGIATDVAVAVGLVLVNAFTKANGWGDFDWSILGFSVAKTGVTTAGAYVLRRFVDPSTVPTPLPPPDNGGAFLAPGEYGDIVATGSPGADTTEGI